MPSRWSSVKVVRRETLEICPFARVSGSTMRALVMTGVGTGTFCALSSAEDTADGAPVMVSRGPVAVGRAPKLLKRLDATPDPSVVRTKVVTSPLGPVMAGN